MKKSNYNFLIPYKKNETIVFNPLYGTIGKLEDKIVEAYNNDTLSTDDQNKLYEKHIFIDDSVDEIEIINEGRVKAIQNPDRKVYRIWTTSGCNARCYYCFELGMKAVNMSNETAIKVANMIADNINEGDSIRLEWFGGEPLLNKEIIKTISEIVIAKCDSLNVKFSAIMISNGSLLTEEVVEMLKKYRVERLQITLDGFKEVYNSSKNYYDPKYNFDLVINNIKLLSANGIRTSIRLNYDNKHYDSLDELLDFLYNEFKDDRKVSAYVYPIWDSLNGDNGFKSEAYADDNYLKIIDKLVRYKFIKPTDVIGLRRKVRQCAARNINSIAILPDGRISKCSESFNQTIGDIDNGITDTKLYNEWTSTELHEECRNCKYLPVCNDGCQSSRYTKMESCFPTKRIFNDIVKWYVKQLDSKLEEIHIQKEY